MLHCSAEFDVRATRLLIDHTANRRASAKVLTPALTVGQARTRLDQMTQNSHSTTPTRAAPSRVDATAPRVLGGQGQVALEQRAEAGAARGVAQTIFPVVRRGQLVCATAISDRRRRALTLEQSRMALEALSATSSETLQQVQRAFYAKLPDQVRVLDDVNDLARGGPVNSLGVIYNYPEFAIAIGEAVTIVRLSVTLCIRPILDATDSEMPFSKFWSRFLLADHPGATGAGVMNLSNESLRAFEEQCAALHAAAMQALVPVYGRIISDAVGEELDLDAESNGAFEVLAVGARDEELAELAAALDAGESLSQQLAEGTPSAERLARFALPNITEDMNATIDASLAKFQSDDAYQLILCETGQSDLGLFLARFKDKTLRFVGMAVETGRRGTGEEGGPLSDAHYAASNVVSANLIARYARQY